jgi:general secretion pathway protein J
MRVRPPFGARPAAFTLIEVLLALAIMATLAITGYRALSGMLEGERHVAQERERWRELDLFFARLEHDLGHALPRAYRIGSTGMPALFLRESALAFVRGNLGEPPQRVGYRWRDGRIELLYWPQLDTPAANAPAAYPVAEGVESWQVSLANRSGQWVERWGEAGAQLDEPLLPRGARVVLTLNDGTRIERVLALQ